MYPRAFVHMFSLGLGSKNSGFCISKSKRKIDVGETVPTQRALIGKKKMKNQVLP